MAYFKHLTALRTDGCVAEEAVKEARESARGGYAIRDLCALDTYLQNKYPSFPFFEKKLTSSSKGAFPEILAQFIIGCNGEWSKVNQHGIYAVYGDYVLTRLRQTKDSFDSEVSYRDEMAGAHQHVCNGLMYAVKAAYEQGQCEITLPRYGLMSLEEAIKKAHTSQKQSAKLRAEKYASPGVSKSYVSSYRSSLLALATCIEILLKVAPSEEVQANLPKTLKDKASSLTLSNDSVLKAVTDGALTAEQEKAVKADLRAASLSSAVARREKPQTPCDTGSGMCLECNQNPSTMTGYGCRCKCLCEDCVMPDLVIECPECSEFTAFIRFG